MLRRVFLKAVSGHLAVKGDALFIILVSFVPLDKQEFFLRSNPSSFVIFVLNLEIIEQLLKHIL